MTYDSMDKDGNVKTLPLFAGINARASRYTFTHPNGVLYATQFAQITLIVTEKASSRTCDRRGLCRTIVHSLV